MDSEYNIHKGDIMGEKLKNPPLVEALCEFRFDESSKWDWAIPGLVYEKIKGEFPNRSEVYQTQAQIPLYEEDQVIRTTRGPNRIQFKKKDESAMIQVGNNLLAINHLVPYPMWESFRTLIIENYLIYVGIANPTGLIGIGLRYINKISCPLKDFEINDYLNQGSPLPWATDYKFNNFFQRYELYINDLKDSLVHQTGFTLQGEERFIILDLDFGSINVKHLNENAEIILWLNQAHDLINFAFVNSINSALYDKLKGDA